MVEFKIGNREPKQPGPTQLGSKKDKSVKAKANAHEYDLADRLDGHRQPGSGMFDAMKGDIQLDNFLLDSKQTKGQTLLLTVKDITKINREAYEAGKHPGLVLTVEMVPSTVPSEWVAVPLTVFAALLKQDAEDSE
jgi:hypothetical protein